MLTVGLCFMVACPDGRAGSSGGGHRRRQDGSRVRALDKMQMGWIFSARILGVTSRRAGGGNLADRHGRKRLLIAARSRLVFGLFSIATALAGLNFRCCCWHAVNIDRYWGWGGALPNLIALTSEAAGPVFAVRRAVSLMLFRGVPIGAAAVAAGAGLLETSAWQTVFWVGGVVPAAAGADAAALKLPESAVFRAGMRECAATGRCWRRATPAPRCCCGCAIFFTLLVVYMLINWLLMLLPMGRSFAPVRRRVMFVLFWGRLRTPAAGGCWIN